MALGRAEALQRTVIEALGGTTAIKGAEGGHSGTSRGVGWAVLARRGRRRVLVRVLTCAGRWWGDGEGLGSDRAAHS